MGVEMGKIVRNHRSQFTSVYRSHKSRLTFVILKKRFSRDQDIEEVVPLHLSVKIAEIDKNRTHSKTLSGIQAPNLCFDFGLNFRSDAPLSLDLSEIGGSGGLYKQINLTAAASGISRMSIGCGRLHDGTAQMQERHKFHGMIYNQILELKTHHGIPSRQIPEA